MHHVAIVIQILWLIILSKVIFKKLTMSLHVNRESNETCEKCNKICNAVHFQQNFDNWTSGDSYIDKLIQDTQLLAHNYVSKALEWIPYNRLVNIEYIVEGFLNVYRADWIDGNIIEWDK